MLMLYGEARQNKRRAAELHTQRFPDRHHPSREFFSRLAHRVRTTGSTRYATTRQRNMPEQDEDVNVDVLAAITVNPQASTRTIARHGAISHMKVHRILKTHSYHPFHLSLHQALNANDYVHRVNFCQWGLAQLQANPEFFRHVLWSDEATFKNDGNVNLHNLHYWSVENPHWMREVNHQVRWSVNVWCGVLNDTIIGPYFFNGTLNGVIYLQFLEDILPQLLEDVPLATRQVMWLQQDGCPAHFRLIVRQHLDVQFPGRWIGRGSRTSWPARSPDLTPLDFYVWGRLKDMVYSECPTTAEDMRVRIRQACAQLTRDEIRRAQEGFTRRLTACINAGGQQFEHL